MNLYKLQQSINITAPAKSNFISQHDTKTPFTERLIISLEEGRIFKRFIAGLHINKIYTIRILI